MVKKKPTILPVWAFVPITSTPTKLMQVGTDTPTYSLCISRHGSLFYYVLCLVVFTLSFLGMDSDGQQALLTASHIVSTIPPAADFDRDAVLTHHYQLIASMEENNLSLSSSSSTTPPTTSSFSTLDIIPVDTTTVWLGYLSTTGVYGNHDGAWVKEGR